MNKKLAGLGGAVGLAATGTLVLVGYVQAAEDRALAGERLVPVLVVDEPVAKGTPVDELADLVRTETVPAKVRAAGAVESLTDLEGQVAAVDLVPGEQLLGTRFGDAEQVAPAGVPDGFEQVTISLEPHRAVGGRVRVGSRVGVLASYDESQSGPARTEILLDEAPVIDVVAAEDAASQAANGTATTILVTLAVSPDDVQRVVYGAEHGRIWLAGSEGMSDPEAVAP